MAIKRAAGGNLLRTATPALATTCGADTCEHCADGTSPEGLVMRVVFSGFSGAQCEAEFCERINGTWDLEQVSACTWFLEDATTYTCSHVTTAGNYRMLLTLVVTASTIEVTIELDSDNVLAPSITYIFIHEHGGDPDCDSFDDLALTSESSEFYCNLGTCLVTSIPP